QHARPVNLFRVPFHARALEILYHHVAFDGEFADRIAKPVEAALVEPEIEELEAGAMAGFDEIVASWIVGSGYLADWDGRLLLAELGAQQPQLHFVRVVIPRVPFQPRLLEILHQQPGGRVHIFISDGQAELVDTTVRLEVVDEGVADPMT